MVRTHVECALALTLVLAGCGGPTDMSGLDGGTDQSTSNACDDVADCDDDVDCTVDSCSSAGTCVHVPSAARCDADSLCHPTDGCMAPRVCGSPSDCVDTDPCTNEEACDTSTATCTHSLLDSDEDGELPLVCGGTDCDDDDDGVGVGSVEICGNEVDDDCDGVTDTDATIATDVTLRNSEANCGTCGNACEQGETCYQGECESCGTAGAPCCNTFCSGATSCSSVGTCTNGGQCIVDGGSALCGPPCGGTGEACCAGATCTNGGECVGSGSAATCSPSCGASGEPCCAGSSCDIGSTCGAGNTCQNPSECSDAGTAVAYRLTTLHIPTPEQANGSTVVGHNVDGIGTTCGVPDFAGGVDNSWIDLAAALPALAPDDPIDLQEEIDAALACPAASQTCDRLDLIVRVASGTGCARIQIVDANGTVLAGPFIATLDASGNLRGQTSSFNFVIPYQDGNAMVDVNVAISNLIFTATRSGNALTNVVLGGYLPSQSFEATIMDIVEVIDDIDFEDLQPILENLYDVQLGGTCSALSVGFLATATQLP